MELQNEDEAVENWKWIILPAGYCWTAADCWPAELRNVHMFLFHSCDTVGKFSYFIFHLLEKLARGRWSVTECGVSSDQFSPVQSDCCFFWRQAMHHRTPNKSLRHVGKLNEGYLSDVHTSFSNLQYDSDASSDLMESTKVLEKQFKDKYRVLRGAYERRIEQLTTSVEAVCARILGDDLIASMRTDAASSVFIPAHISETLASYLKGDRESDIQDLLERESALNIQLTRKNAIIDNQNARLAELEKDTTKGKSSEGELEALQDKVKSLEAQYSAYSQHAKEEMDELRRQSETETNLRKSLQEQYDKSQGELSVCKYTLRWITFILYFIFLLLYL